MRFSFGGNQNEGSLPETMSITLVTLISAGAIKTQVPILQHSLPISMTIEQKADSRWSTEKQKWSSWESNPEPSPLSNAQKSSAKKMSYH
jgi:hypothetical protein